MTAVSHADVGALHTLDSPAAPLLVDLAARARAMTLDRIPPAILTQAKLCVLDTLPLTDEEVVAKFMRLTCGVLGEAAATACLRHVMSIETASRVDIAGLLGESALTF